MGFIPTDEQREPAVVGSESAPTPDPLIGVQVSYAGQTVIIRSAHTNIISGTKSYLIEFSDGSFARARRDALRPIDSEGKPVNTELKSMAQIVSRFLRQPSKKKVVLR